MSSFCIHFYCGSLIICTLKLLLIPSISFSFSCVFCIKERNLFFVLSAYPMSNFTALPLLLFIPSIGFLTSAIMFFFILSKSTWFFLGSLALDWTYQYLCLLALFIVFVLHYWCVHPSYAVSGVTFSLVGGFIL